VALKGEESLFEFRQRREVVWGEDLSLNDREVDPNLVEPARVDRSVDEDGVGPFGAEAADSFLAPMSGAVIHDPEDAASRLIRLSHHFT
jgi:hypothetical protein